MKALVFSLLFISSYVYADEIQLAFSNGWNIKLDDTKYDNYDYPRPGDNIRVHHTYHMTSFAGATSPKDRGQSVYLEGLFKHTVQAYSDRGDLSVIEFKMTSRELANRTLQVFRQDVISFESEGKPFKGLKGIAPALKSSIGKKYMYKAVEVVENKDAPQEDKKTTAAITLVGMSINGVPQTRKKPVSEVFLDLFRFN